MKQLFYFSLLFLTTTLAAYGQSYWENLPKQEGLVNDFENLFTDEQEKTLNALLLKVQVPANAKIVVVTVLKESTPNEGFEAFTLQLANSWNIGEAGKENGILIAVSAGHRRIRIQNAKGIVRRLSDAETKAIIDNFMIPEFKNSEYYEGVINGLKEILEHLKQNK